jgi:diacylglycerol kinase (ATP)
MSHSHSDSSSSADEPGKTSQAESVDHGLSKERPAPPIRDARRSLVVIQRNPRSGSGRGRRELLHLIRELRSRRYRVRMFRNRLLLDQFLQNPNRHNELRCLVAAGGDGTVADLTNRYSGIPVAILPLGTENLIARYLKISRCGYSVARMIDSFHVRPFDTFLANGHRILLMLSVGADAEVVRRLHAARSGNISHFSYLPPILKSFCLYRPSMIVAKSDDAGPEIAGSHVIVTNIPAYGFGFPFAPDAQPDDGLLDVRVFTGRTRGQTLIHAVSVWFGLRRAEKSVVRFRCQQLTVFQGTVTSVTASSQTQSTAAPVQCDGDPGPELPLQITVDPASLLLITPV